MQRRYVGRTGLQVSRLALGTMTWGRDTDDHEAQAMLTRYLEAGGNFLDTAVGYTDGDSERLIGQLLGKVVPRDELVIATKGGISRRGGERVIDVSRGRLLKDLDESLQRLGVDHVDLWQVHTWSADVPIEETLGALDHAVATGRAAYVGISNYSGWQTAQAATWQAAHPGRPPIVANQVEYSLLNRTIEAELVPAAEALNIGLLPWSPLGRGVLTGKYRDRIPADSRAASSHMASFVGRVMTQKAERIVDAVARAADGLGWTPIEVALAWVRDRPGVVAPIVGARTAGQLDASLKSEERVLPAELIAALDDVSAPEGV